MNIINRVKQFVSWILKDARGKDPVSKVYDDLGKDDLYGKTINYANRKRTFIAITSQFDFESKNVLDLACGTGVFIDAIEKGTPKSIVGVDLSSQMLEIAKKNLERFSNLELINASFMDVDIPNNPKFDFILMANAARYIPFGKEIEFFNRVENWLAPGGKFLIASDYPISDNYLGKLVSRFLSLFINKSRLNPNTIWGWNLKKEIGEHMRIEKELKLDADIIRLYSHTVYVCTVKN